jgi:pyridoxal phosphate enzyme (YggS family)
MPLNLTNLKLLQSETQATGVTLVAVSKTQPTSLIMEAYEAGQKIFGENYVQELVDKQAMLPADISWHFIGHLQSNKVKYIAPFITMIHGIDSISLLREINKQALKNNRIIQCLLQIYIAEEESKFGFDFKEAEELLRSFEIDLLKNVIIKGVMGMATNTPDAEQVEKEFRSLSAFYDRMKKEHPHFNTLSMGMTGDYKIALRAGSNMIRIGSAIFGHRGS